ncbi:hypothetical protein V8F20_011961 [Naviculisporaceae sp. PSN 640]
MDCVWVVLIPQIGFGAPVLELDPEADVLVVVPPSSSLSGKEQPAALYHPAGLKIKVSAKHLRTASPIFKSKLAYFHHTTSTQPDGRIHLRLANGFDPKAVYIVLSTLHPGPATSRLPKQLDSLETLAQVALFTEKFSLVDIVEVYAERWINRLWKGASVNYGRNWALWGYVAYVFGRQDIFDVASRRLIEGRSGSAKFEALFESLGLLPSKKFVAELESRHSELLNNAMSAVNAVMDKIIQTEDNCQCATALLGTLVTAMSKSGTLRWRLAELNTKPLTAGYADYAAAIKGGVETFTSWRASITPKGTPKGSRVVTPVHKTDPLGVNGFSGINGKLWTPESSPRFENGVDGWEVLDKHSCSLDDLVKRLEAVFAKRG